MLNKILGILLLFAMSVAHAGAPLWTITPTTGTTFSVPSNSSATIQYTVTNQSNKSKTLTMSPMQGITQVTIGTNVCGTTFTLPSKGSSCVLSLQAIGYQLTSAVTNGPVVCENGSPNQCYRPGPGNLLNITPTSALALPSNCVSTGDNNIQCVVTSSGSTNYGFTNMSYALCRSAQCPYDGSQSSVTCSCQLISAGQGIYSASTAPNNYSTSKPVGNMVTSTYSTVNSGGETPTSCSSGPFANCFGATCVVNGSSVTCTCPVVTSAYIAPQTNCTLGGGLIWSATSTASFNAISDTMNFIYNNFFGGNSPPN